MDEMRNTSEAFSKINALTQEQRDVAYEDTRRRIAGKEPVQGRKPEFEDFIQRNSKYPPGMRRMITALCGLMLAATFIPSAMRLNQISLMMQAPVILHTFSIYVASVCVVLMAEIGQVIFSLAATDEDDRMARNQLRIGALICLAIALIGNAVAEGNHALENALAPFLTFAPPVLVMITASVLKKQMVTATLAREEAIALHASVLIEWESTHTEAVRVWQSAYENAESDPAWERTLANVLRNALRSANKQSKAALRDLTALDWHALVMRERQAEEWWDTAQAVIREAQEQERESLAKLREASVSREEFTKLHETSVTPKPRVKIHEIAREVHSNGDENLSAAEMMEKYGISLGSTAKVRELVKSMNGHGEQA